MQLELIFNTLKTIEPSTNNHMGHMVKKAVEEQHMSVSDFSKAMHCSRTNVYSIFERKTIHVELLERIVDILKLNISDFIMIDKSKPQKCVAIIETNSEKVLELLTHEYGVTYLKSWKIQ